MKSDFYAVTAQVLPVVFLAAAVEFRLLQPSEEEVRETPHGLRADWLASNLVIIVGFGLTVSIGEFAALRAVAQGEAPPPIERLVIASLLVAGFSMVLTPVMNILLNLERATRAASTPGEPPPGPSGRAYNWASGIATLIALACLATPGYGLWLVITGIAS